VILSMAVSLFFLPFFLAFISATVYFEDDFSGADLSSWVQSTARDAGERGAIELSAGKWVTDEKSERGLRTSEDARFYVYSKTFPEFSNKDKNLVIQYSLKHENVFDCGGGYLKLHPKGLDQAGYTGDSAYSIMFGPDHCGSTSRVHFILNYKGKNHLIKNDIDASGFKDALTHTYTLILKPDNTFSVLVDGEEKSSGSIEDNFDVLEPKKIKDPSISKPADWVDEAQIDDPEDEKPEGWDDIPATIVDPEATKPSDWDDELDGEWEAPTISNPEFKGPFRAKRIDNPAYKGVWVHPEIENPDYKYDSALYAYESLGAVGLEVWQVRSGSIIDNILVTDDIEGAAAAREKYSGRKTAEKERNDAESAKQAEEEAAKKAAEDATKGDDEKEDEHPDL